MGCVVEEGEHATVALPLTPAQEYRLRTNLAAQHSRESVSAASFSV